MLARQAQILQHIAQATANPYWPTRLVATASAESNVVAPGATYRAELGLVSYYPADKLKMHMTCNGQPVPIGSDGIGQASFRAPTRPGPATWTGAIRLNQNGRDTTFKVTVPYRVARR